MKNNTEKILRHATRTAICFLLTITALIVKAQTLTIFDVDTTSFPQMKGQLYCVDRQGANISLASTDIRLKEDGFLRNIISVSCPAAQTAAPLSIVLSFDISSSMRERVGGETRIDIVKEAGRELIQGLPPGSECAIVSFDHLGYVNQDFTMDKQKLLSALSALQPQGETNYEQGLLAPPSGAIHIAKSGKYKRAIVFLTDGLDDIDTTATISAAAACGAEIYCVAAGLPIPSSLNVIALRTGGVGYGNVNTKDEARNVYIRMLRQAQTFAPCEIAWESAASCTPLRLVEVEALPVAASATLIYTAPKQSVVMLETTPISLDFGKVLPGQTKDVAVTFTARGGQIAVQEIMSSATEFSVVNGNVPPVVNLAEGQSHNIVVRYTAPDSAVRFTQLTVQSSACISQALYGYAGFPGKVPQPPTLRLLFPNGGEELLAGSDTLIQWTGILPRDTVLLEFSSDGGSFWNEISRSASGLSYLWNVPGPPSQTCSMRITQISGTGANTAFSTIALRGHQNTVRSVEFSPDGSTLLTASSDGTWKLWSTEDGSLLKSSSQTEHAGIVYMARFSRDGKRFITAGADNTARVWETASGARAALLPASGEVRSAALDAVGSLALLGSESGETSLWDVPLESKKTNFPGHSDIVYDVRLGYGDDVTLSGSGDKNVFMWQIAPKTLRMAYTGHTNSVRALQFNPIGNRFATVCADGFLRIYDTNAASPRRVVAYPTGIEPRSLSWSPDGAQIATVGTDRVIRTWDAETGLLIRTYQRNEFSEPLTDVSWSPDGRRLATSCENGNAYILDILSLPFQRDSSDNLWAIVAPALEVSDIDFGILALGQRKDSIFRQTIRNIGVSPIVVTSVSVDNSQEFRVVGGTFPTVLPVGGEMDVEFRFSPSAVGVRTASFSVVMGSYSASASLRGIGIQPRFRLLSSNVDFGDVSLGGRKTLDDLTLFNEGDAGDTALVEIIGGDEFSYSIESPHRFFVPPHSSIRLPVAFSPALLGRSSSSASFSFSNSPEILYSTLTGRGTGGMIAAPQDSGMIGDVAVVALRFIGELPDPAENRVFEGVLRYNSTILSLLDNRFPIIENNGIAELSVSGKSAQTDTLALIPFRVCLGTSDTTALELSGFHWKDASGNAIEALGERNGSFQALGICREGGNRFFNFSGAAALKTINPNPWLDGAEISVEFSLSEIGGASVVLVNISGKILQTIVFSQETPAGEYRIKFDAADILPGCYRVLLRTATQMFAEPLVVLPK